MTDRIQCIRLLVVDDHYMTRFGIVRLLTEQSDMQVVAEAGDGATALRLYETHKPDLVLMDLKMDHVDGVAATRMLMAQHPEARVLVLSSFDTEQLVRQACQAGAAGFVLKESGAEEILAAIRAVSRGQAHMPLRLWRLIAGNTETEELSVREQQVLKRLAAGQKTRDVAQALDLSLGTVKMYISRTFTKLGVDNRSAAIAEARKRGLIE